MKKTTFFFTALLLFVYQGIAQRGYDDPMDSEEQAEFERYAHVGLSGYEWASIAVGVVLLLIAQSIRSKNKTASNVTGGLGILAILPLVLVVLSLAQKILALVLILGVILGVLYLLFGESS